MPRTYASNITWMNALDVLIFHGQEAEVASVFNLTDVFEVAALYGTSRLIELKLCVACVIGTFSKKLAGYSEGHYLLTPKGGARQARLLAMRGLNPEDVWPRHPSEIRTALDRM